MRAHSERSADMAKVRVGLVGSGFAAELHMHGYRRVYGVEAEVTAGAARADQVIDSPKKHPTRTPHRVFGPLPPEKDIAVVDIAPPPASHASMIVGAVQAENHVICKNPSPGFFGRAGNKP